MTAPGVRVPRGVEYREEDDLIGFGDEEDAEGKSANQRAANVVVNDRETSRIFQDRQHGRFDRRDELGAEAVALMLVPFVSVAQVGLCLGAYEQAHGQGWRIRD